MGPVEVADRLRQGVGVGAERGERHVDLIGLPGIAQVETGPEGPALGGDAVLFEFPLRLGGHHRQRLPQVAGVEPHHPGPQGGHQVVADVGGEDPQGGVATRDRGDDHPPQRQFLGDVHPVGGAGAAEGDQGEVAGVAAPLDGDGPQGVHHVGVDQPHHPHRRLGHREAQGPGHVSLDGPGGQVDVGIDLSPQPEAGIVDAQDQVGVGDGGEPLPPRP